MAISIANALLTVDQEDYNSTSIDVTFSPDESVRSVHVPIINDSSPEPSEFFYVYLTISHQSEHLQSATVTLRAVAEILFNDCKSLDRGSTALHRISQQWNPLIMDTTGSKLMCPLLREL